MVVFNEKKIAVIVKIKETLKNRTNLLRSIRLD